MTNEEKLGKILKETFPNVIFIWHISQEGKEVSIHMSTDWLEDLYTEKEQEPCEDGMWSLKDAADALKRHGLLQRQEPCEDAISRQAVLDAFNLSEKTRKYGGDHSGYETMMLYEIQDVIEDLPSIQPKPKTGHWTYICNSRVNGLKIVECSECGKRTYGSSKYCPNCGCHMGESSESEE